MSKLPKGWRRPPTAKELALLELRRPTDPKDEPPPAAQPDTAEQRPPTYSDEADPVTAPTVTDRPRQVTRDMERLAKERKALEAFLPRWRKLGARLTGEPEQEPEHQAEPPELELDQEPEPEHPDYERTLVHARPGRPVQLEGWLLALVVGLAIFAGVGFAAIGLLCGLLLQGRS